MSNKRERKPIIIGIYKITNKKNGHAYIGQSVDIYKRWTNHKIAAFNKNDDAYKYPICRAFRRYGVENFDFEILEECRIDELNEKEIHYIALYNTFFYGYNQTLGGEHSSLVPKENIIGIFHDLETTQMVHKEIADKWNVSRSTVDWINTGRMWHQDGREYPIQKYNPPKKEAKKCSLCGKEISKKATYCKTCRIKENAKTVQPIKKKVKGTLLSSSTQSTNRVTKKPSKDQLKYDILRNSMTIVADKFGVTDNAVRKWCKSYDLPYKYKDILKFREELNIKEYNTNINNDINKKEVFQYDNSNHLIKSYDSISSAAKDVLENGRSCGTLKTIVSRISACCKGERPTAYGYIWKFA